MGQDPQDHPYSGKFAKTHGTQHAVLVARFIIEI